MAASAGGTGTSNQSQSPYPPKILLAKPGLVAGGSVVGKYGRGGSGGEDEPAALRSRLPSVGTLNLLSECWDFHIDRFLPFLTDNTDFSVIGVIGPPGVGKSTIMNELYGFDASSPGMLPPFTIQSEDTRANARHCSMGIEPRISSERIILLDTQPVFSPSVLAEMMRPDGSSTISVLTGESLSAELAYELMGIQLGVLLSSVCNILLVVSDGVHHDSMWHLMSTVDLLKHGIPDPSSLTLSQNTSLGNEKENKIHEGGEFIAAPVFVHTKIHDQDFGPQNHIRMKAALGEYFKNTSFFSKSNGSTSKGHFTLIPHQDQDILNFHMIPSKNKDDSSRTQRESYISALWKLRDEILSMKGPSFGRTVSEREWLKNVAKIWELVRNSPIILEYCRTLQNSGMFRR